MRACVRACVRVRVYCVRKYRCGFLGVVVVVIVVVVVVVVLQPSSLLP
jgi:hypothetical protein